MKVLLADDGSERSRRTTEQALAVLRIDPPVTILRVVPSVITTPGIPIAGEAAPVLSPELMEQEVRSAREDVERAVAALGVAAEGRVERGDAGIVICDIARSGGFDVVVVGSHGRGVVKQLVLGSVSHYVLKHAPCPVLVVRSSSPE